MFLSPLVVLDFETSGMSPESGGRVTEVAALRIERGCISERFVSLVNSGVFIPPFITQLTGITQDMVDQAPPATEVFSKLLAFIGEDYLVAHNASFDEKFLFSEASFIEEVPRHAGTICSVKLARRIVPGLETYSLGPLAMRLGIKFNGRAHRAEADAEVTAKLMLELAARTSRDYALEVIDPALFVQVNKLKSSKVSSFLQACALQQESRVINKEVHMDKVNANREIQESKPIRFRHYKGGIYELVGEATQESDLSPVIVYRSHDGSMWTRPKSVFFEMLTINGQQVQRFTPMDE